MFALFILYTSNVLLTCSVMMSQAQCSKKCDDGYIDRYTLDPRYNAVIERCLLYRIITKTAIYWNEQHVAIPECGLVPTVAVHAVICKKVYSSCYWSLLVQSRQHWAASLARPLPPPLLMQQHCDVRRLVLGLWVSSGFPATCWRQSVLLSAMELSWLTTVRHYPWMLMASVWNH